MFKEAIAEGRQHIAAVRGLKHRVHTNVIADYKVK
jgi:hypothetical protein